MRTKSAKTPSAADAKTKWSKGSDVAKKKKKTKKTVFYVSVRIENGERMVFITQRIITRASSLGDEIARVLNVGLEKGGEGAVCTFLKVTPL